MQKVAIFQHADGEWIGSMTDWFANKDFQLKTYHLDLNEPLPTIDQFDWLLIMGGPMSVYEEDRYPWLVAEKAIIKQAIELDKTVLGICLGGQLIASSMGADVRRNVQHEVGWHALTKTNSCASWMPDDLVPLSWHYDCFNLPKDAIAFASSEITPNQGFKLAKNVWALQFHLEAQANTASAFLALEDTGLLPIGDYVQSESEVFTTQYLEQSQQAIFSLLDLMNSP